jgi:aryl-alcohol dehydrogenase-like predicted oxidoreductase
MEHRPLGCTGVSVSKLCLGAMMFGAWVTLGIGPGSPTGRGFT